MALLAVSSLVRRPGHRRQERSLRAAKVIVEADTRALRHVQRRRAFELVSA
jgi:hypothetical protein